MSEAAVAVVALLIGVWALTSGWAARYDVTGPITFTFAGYLLGNPDWGPLDIAVGTSSLHTIAEVTLVLILFSDAARVHMAELRRDVALPTRLLGIGLPLSVILGGLIAAALLDALPWALAGFLGAALAPTDAALSAQVIGDERIPMRLRRGLNVESGLNDGIATPIVTVMLAIAASQIGVITESEAFEAFAALRELAIGVVVGLGFGWLGARLIALATTRHWVAPGGRRIAVLALAIGAFATTLAADGNGFVAAFTAGIVFGTTLDRRTTDLERSTELPELAGQLLALVVWFLFGATLVPIGLEYVDLPILVYAVASLTVVRMIPVGLAMYRSGLDRPSVVFLSWFGPRGLASVVFALLAIEELGETSVLVNEAVATVSITVLLSVILHGVSATPGGRRYAQREQQEEDAAHPPRPRLTGPSA